MSTMIRSIKKAVTSPRVTKTRSKTSKAETSQISPDTIISQSKLAQSTDIHIDNQSVASFSSDAANSHSDQSHTSQIDSHESINDLNPIDDIQRMMKQLLPKISLMEQDIKSIKQQQDEALNIKWKVTTIEQDMVAMKSTNESLTKENKLIKEKLLGYEAYSRRNNLRLRNVPEGPTPLMTTLTDIFKMMELTDINKIMIDDLHRKGAPDSKRTRVILFRLVLRTDRERIWKARSKLKGTKYILDEDLPHEYERQQSILRPLLITAKSKGMKSTMVGNKVAINSKLFGVEDINSLPPDLDPAQACITENDNVLCFFWQIFIHVKLFQMQIQS